MFEMNDEKKRAVEGMSGVADTTYGLIGEALANIIEKLLSDTRMDVLSPNELEREILTAARDTIESMQRGKNISSRIKRKRSERK
ncbi:MAG TPA: hypothetical protein VLH19_00075 [Patescibacteria group bacterium]|nr:hypothetical protein [Patescibacteria group bacterium]